MENQQFDILAIKNLDEKITSRWLVFWRKIWSHSYFVSIFISWITLCGRTMDVIQASRYTIQIWLYKCLKGIIPIRKCSIKSPAIWRQLFMSWRWSIIVLCFREPYYYLFFSASGCDNIYYHIGVARSKTIKGPYIRFDDDILHFDEEK